jgi:protein-tyrosine phosphatase
MRDLHCHILPGVDDGAEDLDESLRMLDAAKAAGVTSMVCTPHCRKPYFDFKAMWYAFYEFEDASEGFPVKMGFEVNYEKLMELGMQWAQSLAFDNEPTFLLELSVGASPSRFGDYERTIFDLQGMGYQVIIAHPERYMAIQRDVSLAQELVDMGCELQASADFIAGGRLGAEKRPAIKMLKSGLYSHIASDAHCPEHYQLLAKAMHKYGSYLRK